MTREDCITRRDQLIAKRDALVDQIAEIDTQSASLSAGGGSKSYTRLDLGVLRKLRTDYAERVTQINRRLAGGPSTGIRRVMTVRY